MTPEELWKRDEERARILAAAGAAPPLPSPSEAPAEDVGHRHPFPFFVGQEILGATVVGVYPQFGAMLDLGGAKRWTNNWLPGGAGLSIGDRVGVRAKTVHGASKKVVVTLLDAGTEHAGRRVEKRGFRKASASDYQ